MYVLVAFMISTVCVKPMIIVHSLKVDLYFNGKIITCSAFLVAKL